MTTHLTHLAVHLHPTTHPDGGMLGIAIVIVLFALLGRRGKKGKG